MVLATYIQLLLIWTTQKIKVQKCTTRTFYTKKRCSSRKPNWRSENKNNYRIQLFLANYFNTFRAWNKHYSPLSHLHLTLLIIISATSLNSAKRVRFDDTSTSVPRTVSPTLAAETTLLRQRLRFHTLSLHIQLIRLN